MTAENNLHPLDVASVARSVATHSRTSHIPLYTVDTAIDTVGLGTFQYVVLTLAGLLWTAESMEMLLLSFIKQPLQCEWGITDSQAALITTSVAIGMLTGATLWGVVADKYGRRLCFIMAATFTSIMGMASALSPNYSMMVVYRGLVGFGIGGVPVAFSLLVEFLPAAQRGTWGLALALFWAVGAMFEAIVAMLVLPVLGWRWLIAISSIPLFIVLLLSFWLSESPHWLVARGDYARAQVVVERVSAVNGVALPQGRLGSPAQIAARSNRLDGGDVVDSELRAAFSAADAGDGEAEGGGEGDDTALVADDVESNGDRGGSSTGSNSVLTLLRPGIRSLVLKTLFLWFSMAFTYYGLVMLQPEMISVENEGLRCPYAERECARQTGEAGCVAQSICSWAMGGGGSGSGGGVDGGRGDAGATCMPTGLLNARENGGDGESACARQLTREDFWSTFWASAGEMPGVMLAFVVVDIIGRRTLLGYFVGWLAVSFFALIYCLSRPGETVVFFIARGASAGAFQVVYLYTNELFPAAMRARAMGLSSSVGRIGLITTPFIAQYLTNIDLSVALITYVVVSLGAFVCTVLLPIETTGRPLALSMEELEGILKDPKTGDAGYTGPTLANDPNAPALVRWLRWPVPIDGRPVS